MPTHTSRFSPAPRTLIATAVVVVACLGVPRAATAQLDNNVQWSGVSHIGWVDRSPRVPRNGEAFTVRFQTLTGDVSSARVRVDNGAVLFVDAAVVSTRGPYDIWAASIPATAATGESYILEITDGTDTDYLDATGMSDALVTTNPFALNFTTLEHAPPGATPVPGGVVFKVWAPTRTACHVPGSFNAWSTVANPMTKVGEHFVTFVPGASAGQLYKFRFNNSTWNTDARAVAFNPADNNNASIVDHDAHAWTSAPFSPDPIDRMVIYQLHVGTFAGRNDPAGSTPNPSRYIDVAARVGHLADLGVNAVLLNPINEFPGDFSGGYNSITPWSIESKLGTPAQFKQMVDALHQQGIAVMLDIVWNHVSATDNLLWNYDGSQQYFDSPTYQDTPWGAQADYDKSAVFAYYLDSAERLLTDFRLDGFRFDATHYMTDSALTTQWSSGQALVRALNTLRAGRHKDKHTIAEIYIDNSWVTTPAPSGLGFTSQYHNEFKEALRSAAFATSNPNMTRVANALDGTNPGVGGSTVLNYFELHDDCWPANGHQRAVRSFDTTAPYDDANARGKTIVAQSLNLLSRGVPAIVMGTEWLEDDGWETSKIDWSHKTTYAGVYNYYRTLIGQRTSTPELYANSPLSAYHINDTAEVIAFERYLVGGGSYVAAVNLSSVDQPSYRIGMPRYGEWSVIVNSNDAQFGGPGGGSSGTLMVEPIASGPYPRSALINLPARSVLLLQHAPLPCPGDFNNSGTVTVQDLFDFLAAWFAQNPSADFNESGAVTVQDLFDFLAAWFGPC